MAIVHVNATISPSKLELARLWLAATDWFDGDVETLRLGTRYSYRFDDPAGEVGVEVLLVGDGDRVLQVPLTYRPAALDGAAGFFLTHMEHSVLGRRWIYDGLGDAVLVNALIRAAVTGGRQENFEVEVAAGQTEIFPALVQVRGTGSAAVPAPGAIDRVDRDGSTTRVHTSTSVLVFPHVAGNVDMSTDHPALVGVWPTSDGEIPLAAVQAVGD